MESFLKLVVVDLYKYMEGNLVYIVVVFFNKCVGFFFNEYFV